MDFDEYGYAVVWTGHRFSEWDRRTIELQNGTEWRFATAQEAWLYRAMGELKDRVADLERQLQNDD